MAGLQRRCPRCNLLRTVIIIGVLMLIIRAAVFLFAEDWRHARSSRDLGITSSDHTCQCMSSSKTEAPRQILQLNGTMTRTRMVPGITRQPMVQSLRSNTKLTHNSLPLCPQRITGLGRFDFKLKPLDTIKEVEESNKNVFNGGRWRPSNCTARHRVAILVPYRNRNSQLRVFLQNIHRFLQTQFIDYGIYIIEQANGTVFNRAKLFNIGYKESMKDYDWQCFVFHDVDLIPEDTRNIYSCPQQPRHMSVAVDVFNYKVFYEGQFGGVAAMTVEQFEKVNGYSNAFFGWGGEDDDMAFRITAAKMKSTRHSLNVARYKMVAHKKDTPDNHYRLYLLHYAGGRMPIDGLNSLKYTLQIKQMFPLYTNISVNFPNDSAKYFQQIKSKQLKREHRDFPWEFNEKTAKKTY